MSRVINFGLQDNDLTYKETTILSMQFSDRVAGLTPSTFVTSPRGALSFGVPVSHDGGFTWEVPVTANENFKSTRGIVSLPFNSYNFVDSTGNVIGPGAAQYSQFKIDTMVPADPVPNEDTTQITVDPVTEDNILNLRESREDVTVSGKVTGKFNAGDTVTVTVNESEFTGTVKTDGSFAVKVSGALLQADPDHAIHATVAATNSLGQASAIGKINTTHAYDVDTAPPQLCVDAPDLTNTATPVITGASDEPAGTEVKLVVTDSTGHQQTLTTTVQADGSYSVKVGTPLAEGNATVIATVTDGAGNSTSAPDGVMVIDTTPPAVALNVDAVTVDNTINAVESAGLVLVSGVVTGEVRTGDVVKLVINGQDYKATVGADLKWSTLVAGSDLAADHKIEASIATADAAGNTGSAQAVHAYTVDTQVETGKLVLNNFSDSFNPYMGDTKTDMLSNDRTYDLNVQGAEQGVSVQYQVLQNGQWVNTTPMQQGMADGSYTYRAEVTDAAGNKANTGTISLQVDATAPNAPTSVVRNGSQLTGMAEAGSVVVAKAGNTVLGTAVVGANGGFTMGLSSGYGDLSVQAIDRAGNVSDPAAAVGNVYKVYTVASSWNSSTGPVDYGSYKTGAGDDWLQIGNGAKNCWLSITQGNIWNKNPWCSDAVIDTGDGNDRIDTGYGGGEGSMFAYTGVKTGAGNDVFNLKGAMYNDCYVDMGTGNDTMTIGCFMGTNTSVRMGDGDDKITVGGNMLACSLIDMGKGNDTAVLNGQVWCGATVRMGEGNDTVVFSGKTVGGGLIDGGSGQDTLVLTYNQDNSLTTGWCAWKNVTNLSTADIKGIEVIKMEGQNVVDVKYADLFNDTSRSGALFIQGNSNDKVDLGSTNWNSDTYQTLSDAGGGRWAMTGSKVVDGVTYDVYHHSYAGSNTLNDVYVQKGVMVI